MPDSGVADIDIKFLVGLLLNPVFYTFIHTPGTEGTSRSGAGARGPAGERSVREATAAAAAPGGTLGEGQRNITDRALGRSSREATGVRSVWEYAEVDKGMLCLVVEPY